VNKRLIFAALGVAAAVAAAIAAHGLRGGRTLEQCNAEADAAVAKLKDRETIYGTAVFVEGNQVLMRDSDGNIQRVEQDVFARQLAKGWTQATREDIRAHQLAVCRAR
jgi:hypothetical protein